MSGCEEGAIGADECARTNGYEACVEECAVEVDVYFFAESGKVSLVALNKSSGASVT